MSPSWRIPTPKALAHGLEAEHAYGVDDRGVKHVRY